MKYKVWLSIVCIAFLMVIISLRITAQEPEVIEISVLTGPPQIIVHEPGNHTTVSSPTVHLYATVSWEKKTSPQSIEVIVNESSAWQKVKGVDPVLDDVETIDIQTDIQLQEGENRITILIADSESKQWEESVFVTYAPQKPNLYILSIGISEYEQENITDLEYAHADAQAIVEAFTEQEGPLYEKIESRMLLNKNASRSAILKEMQWLTRQVKQDKQNSLAILFVSGHGAEYEEGLKDYYFLPYDADPASLIDTAIPWFQFNRMLETLQALADKTKTVFLIDTCHAGGITGAGIKGVPPPNPDAIEDFVTAGQGGMVIASSSSSEESREHPDWEHGAFTKVILDGLAGEADRDMDGIIYTTELYEYVSSEVPILNPDQHPTIDTETGYTRFPLVVLHQQSTGVSSPQEAYKYLTYIWADVPIVDEPDRKAPVPLGSGVIWEPDLILTNYNVACRCWDAGPALEEFAIGTAYDIYGERPESKYDFPVYAIRYIAEYQSGMSGAYDWTYNLLTLPRADWALLRITKDSLGKEITSTVDLNPIPRGDPNLLKIGDPVYVWGYASEGQQTPTFYAGNVSGRVSGGWIKSANLGISSGINGGPVLNSKGELIGLATVVSPDSSMLWIMAIDTIQEQIEEQASKPKVIESENIGSVRLVIPTFTPK